MKFVLVLASVLALNAMAQDKEKIITGQENILRSELVKVGDCTDNSLELLADISRHLNGSYTFITPESKLKLTLNEEVEVYDLKRTKTDGQKTEEKINVRIVDRDGVVRTKSFARNISTTNTDGSVKNAALLVAEITATVFSLKNDCEVARKQYIESL